MALTPTVLEDLAAAFDQDVSYANAAVWLALHSANPGTTGANELSGGGYARIQLTFAGSGGVDTVAALTSFTVPAATVSWVGCWDDPTATGTSHFKGGFPLVGTQQIATLLSGTSVIDCPAHGLFANMPVRLYTLPAAASAIPAGFAADTIYYVKTVPSSDSVTLAATLGGTPIVASSSGGFLLCVDQTQVFLSAGVLELPAVTGITYTQA